MRTLILSISFLIISISGCKISRPAADLPSQVTPADNNQVKVDEPPIIKFSEQTTWLLGYFNPDMMKREPHSEWYFKNYDDYIPETEMLNRLLDIPVDGISIKVIMGTWCPDSRREVPRFMRILDAWQFPKEKVVYIGVDDAKLSPVSEYEMLGIQRVPTFIIYKNNFEAGRIIENPVTSLEQDMVNILIRKE